MAGATQPAGPGKALWCGDSQREGGVRLPQGSAGPVLGLGFMAWPMAQCPGPVLLKVGSPDSSIRITGPTPELVEREQSPDTCDYGLWVTAAPSSLSLQPGQSLNSALFPAVPGEVRAGACGQEAGRDRAACPSHPVPLPPTWLTFPSEEPPSSLQDALHTLCAPGSPVSLGRAGSTPTLQAPGPPAPAQPCPLPHGGWPGGACSDACV